jgi:DNA-binding MarR family transcriptional regulator
MPTLAADRDATVERVLAEYEALMQRLAGTHAPEFLEIDVTMPQAKVLYLLRATGDLSMSDLVARLGVTLPTVSGIVDRLVEHGLVARRGNPEDRRRVFVGITPAGVALIDRFRDLNARQVRDLLGILDDDDLAAVRAFLAVLDRGIARLAEAAAAGKAPSAPEAAHPLRSTTA